MDIQLYDTYFVLPWYSWLPIVLTITLIGLFIAISRLGIEKLYFITLCVAVGLLLSLSQWVGLAATIAVTLGHLSGKATDVYQTDQGYLSNLGSFIFAYQLTLAAIILLLSWQMTKHVSKHHSG